MKKLVIAAALVAASAMTFAQGGGRMFGRGGGGGSPTMLLMRSDVIHDVGLSDEQKDKLAKIREDAQAAMQERMQNSGFQPGGPPPSEEEQKKFRAEMQKFQEEQESKVNAVITPDQQKRLLEIFVQLNGASSITNKTVQKGLGLTDDQIAKIKSLQDKQQAANREIFQKMRDGELDRSEVRPLMEKNNAILKTEFGKLLTEAQSKKLKAMEGEKKFTPDPDEEGGGGPRGG